MEKHFLIGMDVGSTTVKAVVMDAATDAILWSDYQRHDTKQPEKVLEFCRRFDTEIEGFRADRSRMFITGSGGNGICSRGIDAGTGVSGCKSAPELTAAQAQALIQAKYDQTPAGGRQHHRGRSGHAEGVTAKYWDRSKAYPNKFWADFTLTAGWQEGGQAARRRRHDPVAAGERRRQDFFDHCDDRGGQPSEGTRREGSAGRSGRNQERGVHRGCEPGRGARPAAGYRPQPRKQAEQQADGHLCAGWRGLEVAVALIENSAKIQCRVGRRIR